MDNNLFDSLTRTLSTPDSRRRLLGALAALPVIGGLFAILDPEDADGKGRRRRRVKRHKHGKGRRRRKHKKKCKADSKAVTCSGTCGSVINNCKQSVDCGFCNCLSSDQCASGEICDGGTCAACNVACTGTAAACGTTLQAAIDAASAGATLRVCPGTYQGGFTISKALRVVGAGQGDGPATNTILDGNMTQRVLLVDGDAGDVTLEHVKITRGEAGADFGGGIWHLGNKLVMRACTLAANQASFGSGLFTGMDRPLEMTRCTVRDNVAPVIGATVPTGGGMVLRGESTVTDCEIVGNSANGGQGGGLFAGANQIITLTGSTTIQRNSATSGGGIYYAGAPLVIGADCRITGNNADAGQGGGIYRLAGLVTLQGPDPSPIVADNCHENCAVLVGAPIAGCAAGGTCPP